MRSVGRSSEGQQVVDVVGVSPFLREKDRDVRRFRMDVIVDQRSSVKERDTADVECAASEL